MCSNYYAFMIIGHLVTFFFPFDDKTIPNSSKHVVNDSYQIFALAIKAPSELDLIILTFLMMIADFRMNLE